MTIKDSLISLPQSLLPQHALSRWISHLTHSQQPALKHFLISQVIRHYGVNMAESLIDDPTQFKSFNDFFTRSLKPDARPLATVSDGIVSPADGVISQAGDIQGNSIIQAKGKCFDLTDLLGGDAQRAKAFHQGSFATIYLSPKDYHRLHMPLSGKLTEMVHIPGRLFSVNAATTRSVNNLFAINERVATFFDTDIGPMALVLVGAIFVSSIETVWHGVVTPPTGKIIQSWDYRQENVLIDKGVEMGRFNMGSTIIVLFGPNKMKFMGDKLIGKSVNLGVLIGKYA